MENKNKLCITSFVFGPKYVEYIPIYIYSILKSYPDYYPLIFYHAKLSEKIKYQLGCLKEIGNFHVVENYCSDNKMTRMKAAALRYFTYHESFNLFSAIYVGDVDLLIVKEKPGIFEQHMNHCSTIDLPYSNIVREYYEKKIDLPLLFKRFYENGIYSVIFSIFRKSYKVSKLSGLHFFQTQEYFQKTQSLSDKYLDIILCRSIKNKWKTRSHSEGFNDECLLYDFIKEADLGFPSGYQYGPHLLDYRRFNESGFRPHHGIHLGIFRKENFRTHYNDLLLNDFYVEYFKVYRSVYCSDPIFQELSKNYSTWLSNIFSRMEKFYQEHNI